MQNRQIKEFRKNLITWYQAHQRVLPWRKNKDPYRIWVSEVMLQQTQVKTVIPYYLNFLEKWPDIAALANANSHDLMKAWEGLGYYSRVHNLHKAARIVHQQLNNIIPTDPKAFKALPGVGDYIMSAVLSIAHNNPLAVVDGNVKRVIGRLECLDAPINQASALKIFKSHADTLLETTQSGTYNQALMELGALICLPKSPKCDQCPVAQHCSALKTNTVKEFPTRLKSKSRPTYRIAVGVIEKDNKLLITQRKKGALLGGMWEFPGGKIEKGETAEEACIREIREEVNLEIKVLKKLTAIQHEYSHFKIKMDIFICQYISGNVQLCGPTNYNWIGPDEISSYPFPGANHKFFPALLEFFNI